MSWSPKTFVPSGIRFELTWERRGPKSADEIASALGDVFDTWVAYTLRIDPRPYYDDVGGNRDTPGFEGGTGVMLNGDGNGPYKLNRYWPYSLTTQGSNLTRQDWLASKDERVEAFKADYANIEKMINDLQASDYWSTEVSGDKPLQDVAEGMEPYISFPANPLIYTYPDCRTEWNPTYKIKMSGGNFDDTDTSYLYEYYFGWAPESTAHKETDKNLVFPPEAGWTP